MAKVPVGLDPLGDPLTRVAKGWYWPAALVCGCIGLALVLGVVSLIGTGAVGPRTPTADSRHLQLMMLTVVGPIGLLLFGLLIYFAWLQVEKSVWIGPRGFAWVTRSRCELFLWEEIKTVRFPLKVVREDGFKVDLSSFVDDWFNGIPFEPDWVAFKLKQAVSEIEQGKMVKFGPFQVERRGIWKGDNLLMWDELDRIIRVTGQYAVLNVMKKGHNWPWASASLTAIPNLLVFEQLVVRMAGEQHRK